jgi:signal transduction histidine kinase
VGGGGVIAMVDNEKSSVMRILLVEDNAQEQIAFEKALSKSGMNFQLAIRDRAEDILPAIEARSVAFDVVVVAQNLAGIKGLDAFRQLRHVSDLPPFIMLTGTGSESLAVNAFKAGMYDYIIKDPSQGYLKLLPFKLRSVIQRHRVNLKRLRKRAKLKNDHSKLEKIVEKRTLDLKRTVSALKGKIAEHKKTETALRESERALRHLSFKIVETQENERKQVAKELHDSIGSSLAAVKFALEEKLQSMQDSPPNGTISLEKIINHIHDTIREVRRISSSLRPSILDDLGLLAAIQWYCRINRDMYADTRIEVDIQVKEEDLPQNSRIVLYRVMQEALNNALKHSGADTIQLSLSQASGCIRMCIKDNGCGFDPELALKNPDPMIGYGLSSMYDRAEVVSAALSIDSGPDRGTSLCLKLPCHLDRNAV